MAAPTFRFPIKADLHCHSNASNEADEAVLEALQCPESYSEPVEVYRQAKQRRMDFVTITDHDSLDGVLKLTNRPDVIVGEEVTCYFPEDHCKIHLLVWGLDSVQHAAIQAVANDIYKVAEYVESQNLAHSVAHPVYRQNDVLERWHLERLALMFKGFECLNGAHSALHREALDPFVDSLTEEYIETLSRRHHLAPRWPQPWIKARTAGSDDHGLFNVGRTWTEFPADATTAPAILDCLREARCCPAGESGSSMKLAHNFFSVGIRYYARQVAAPNSAPAKLLGMLIGEHPSRLFIATAAAKAWAIDKCNGIVSAITRRKHAASGTALLNDILGKSLFKRLGETPALSAAMKNRTAPLAEHAAMFNLVSAVNRDVAQGIREAVSAAMKDGCVGPAFDAISAVAAHQFLMFPYYFALFHQNRERSVLARVTGNSRSRGQNIRVGLFTDTLDEVNGVGRFIRVVADQAQQQGASLIVHTCNTTPQDSAPWRKNFSPMLSLPMPMYEGLSLNLPPLLDVLEWADRQQFDAIHVSTPGPMGLMGWLVAKMLRIPLLGVYHTDFPLYVNRLTGDYRLTATATAYMQWFYAQTDVVFSRSRAYLKTLEKLGVETGKLRLLPPSVDSDRFNPERGDHRVRLGGRVSLDADVCDNAASEQLENLLGARASSPALSHRKAGEDARAPRNLSASEADSTDEPWSKLGVKEPYRVLYAGRVSAEKNLPMLVESFKILCASRKDVALVIAGDGPYMTKMKVALAALPAYFLGFQSDQSLRTLYANSDLFAFPSRTDTLGQVVMEAQACGLPVLVSNEGGPQEMMDDGLSGRVLPGEDAGAWSQAMIELLDDAPLRQRMARTAPLRMARYAPAHAFETFWSAHVAAVDNAAEKQASDATQSGAEQLAHAVTV